MSDREDIIQLINLYGFAMDTQRWELFDRIFTADCDADYGPTSHWTDLARFKADFGPFHEVFDATQHVRPTTSSPSMATGRARTLMASAG